MLAQPEQADDDNENGEQDYHQMNPSSSTSAGFQLGAPSSPVSPAVSPLSVPNPLSTSHPLPVFNVLVVGQAGVGKTGLIKLLIDTSQLASTSNTTTSSNSNGLVARLARLAEFANYAATCPTTSLAYATADLPSTNLRPQIVLNLIDTPGLLFHDPQELEKGVNLALRQITDSFNASLAVPAQERADKQIHLCLYLLDPADIVPSSTRHLRKPDRYGVPIKLSRQRVHLAAVRNVTSRSTGDTTPTTQPMSLSAPSANPGEIMAESQLHYDDGDEWGRATVPKAELRVMRRLSEFVSVLPVVAKADTLTIERLQTVKIAVRRDFEDTGLSFTPFESVTEEHQHGVSTAITTTTPPPETRPLPVVSTIPILPYSIMLPDRYHHGDGVARTGTAARPSHQDYMTQYQSAQVAEENTNGGDGLRPIQPGQFTRSYRWGVIDVLDRSNSDFLALREAILGSNVQLLRSRTLDVYFEAYKKSLTTTPLLSPGLQSSIPPQPPSFPHESIAGPSQPPLPSLPPTSLFSYQTSNTRSIFHHHPHSHSHHQPDHHPPSRTSTNTPITPSEYALPPLEMPIATGSRDKMLPPSRPAPLAPISAVLNPPPLKHARSAPALVSPEDEIPTSRVPSPAQPSRQRTGRKIAVACNFCRSRKLKCDGGRPQCIQCMRRTVDCEYEPAAKRRGLGKHAAAATSQTKGGTAGHQPSTSSGDDPGALPPKTVACQFCRARKTRCDGLQPRCSNCEKRNQECIYLPPPTLEEEIASISSSSRPRTASGASATQWTPTLPPPGHHARESLPFGSEYRQPQPQYPPHALSLQGHSPESPPSKTSSLSGPVRQHQPDIDPFGRVGSFALPTTSHPGSFSSDTRRSDAAPSLGERERESFSWRDRSSISSSSTRGGMSATPSSPAIKRKASYFTEEEERRGEELETSPSPLKRRRLSRMEDEPYIGAEQPPPPTPTPHPPGDDSKDRGPSGSSSEKRGR